MNKTWFAFVFAIALGCGAKVACANSLTPDDEKYYRQAFEAVNRDHSDWAIAFAAKAHDKLLGKVLRWYIFTQPNSGAMFGEIVSFIQSNPTWPQMATLRRRAEEAISVATPESMVLEWFANNPPQTVSGAMAYGKALINNGQNEKAAELLRATWINGNFGPLQERQFLASFRDLLTRQDQILRLDRLLWDHQDSAVEHQILRVDEDYRLLAQARIALDNAASNGEAIAARVPAELKDDPGLIYELVRFRRQLDRDEQAIELLKHPGHDQSHPEMWWSERAILARRALQRGAITQAYTIASEHRQKEGTGFADAEWFAGWIALRFLSDHEEALRHFQRLYDNVGSPHSRARGAYWTGRALEVLGRQDEAIHWFNIAGQNITSFYGQLAASKLNPEQQWPLPADPVPNAEDIRDFEHHELVRAAHMLSQIKQTDLIRPFMLRMNDLAKTPGQKALAANLATEAGRSDIAVALARHAEREGVPLITSGYPIPALSPQEKPERALVLGVIRQESAFHHAAVSSAGARGLMQLMPSTAAKIAKALKVVFRKKDALASALTNDPGLNVKIGSAYLNDLLDDFNGSYVLSIAAYNAGPSRVRKWLREQGDPRTRDVDAVDWIEEIPFSETRNYVQRVLEGVQIYRRRMGMPPLAMSLERDLKR
ncbi:MAG TPA: lytic transglycosylase domain-containing protein [Rhodospirillaceae bacterium]|nr:lytic transglycosylase domain-containing protein [Rhodospirillaceae bacterium]